MQTKSPEIVVSLPVDDAKQIARQLAVSANQYMTLSKHFQSNVAIAYIHEANACRLLAARLEAAISTQS